MKKLIFGLLIVLPIAILMVVGLVTAFISNAVKVSVEDVSLDPHSLVLEIGEYELDELFTVTIYPEAAANSPYEWTIKDVRSRDENYDDDDNGTGGVYFAELLDADGNVKVGAPYVDGAVVKATVLDDTCRGKKVLVFKKKRRKGYQKLTGHRQNLSKIKINEIA